MNINPRHYATPAFIVVLAAIALYTGLFSYRGGLCHSEEASGLGIWETAYQVIDHAQIYYTESLARGENTSYNNLTFPQLGWTSPEDSVLILPDGKLYLENTGNYTFDLVIIDKAGKRFAARNLTFNSRPVF